MISFLKSLVLVAILARATMALSVPTLNMNTNTTSASNLNVVSNGVLGTAWDMVKSELQVRNKWAQFCDDDNCSQNCGMSVRMGDPGCLEQPRGRRSIRVHGMRRGLDGITLTVSPRQGCHCQAVCSAVESKGPRVSPPLIDSGDYLAQSIDYCWTISKFEWYGMHTEWSFRFNQGSGKPECGADQCRWDNSALVTAAPP